MLDLSRQTDAPGHESASFTLTEPISEASTLRRLYLDLVKQIILNDVYEPGPHIEEGREWPPGDA
jgi:hypothetical protein